MVYSKYSCRGIQSSHHQPPPHQVKSSYSHSKHNKHIHVQCIILVLNVKLHANKPSIFPMSKKLMTGIFHQLFAYFLASSHHDFYSPPTVCPTPLLHISQHVGESAFGDGRDKHDGQVANNLEPLGFGQ